MKSLTKTLILLTLILSAVACNKQVCNVSGNVGFDLAGETLYFQLLEEDTIADSVRIDRKGNFRWQKELKKRAICKLLIRKGEKLERLGGIVLEPGNVSVRFSQDVFNAYGGEINQLLRQFVDIYLPIDNQLEVIYWQWVACEDAVERERLEHYYDSLEVGKNQSLAIFAKEHYDNLVGALALSHAKLLTEAEQEQILSVAEGEFLEQKAVKEIAKRLTQLRRVAVGLRFVDFTLQSPENEPVSLSDYAGNGNYLVVDFWASWCGPCRRAMPNLKELYAKYHPKGVEFLGVSLDREHEAWLNGIEKLQLPWPQMSDLKGWKSEGATIYCVNLIPHLMLIDPDGIIVAKNLNDSELEEKLEEIFD